MKKIIIFIILITGISRVSNAQQNKVLIETFTEVDCICCPGSLEYIFEMYKEHPDKMILLSYQTALLNQSYLYNQDSMDYRWRYYTYYTDFNEGVPRGKPDGVHIGYNIIDN